MGGLDTVLSAGTYTIKAGYADVNETTLLPSIEVPSKVKRDGKGSGAENGGHGGVSQLIDGAEVKDWDGLEVVLRYILYEQLGWIQGEEGNILMAEPYGTSRDDKERMTQLLFEQLNANGVFFAEESVLSLYSVGKVSGVSIDMAHSGINVMAVVDGQPMAQTATRIPCGGRELSAMMQAAIMHPGDGASHSAAFEGIYDANPLGCYAKEKVARVAATEEEYTASAATSSSSSSSPAAADEEFTLPDGSNIRVRECDRLMVGEAVFQPEKIFRSAKVPPSGSCAKAALGPGVVDATIQAVLNSHTDHRRLLLDQIVVWGGTSRLRGLRERLLTEITARAPGTQRPTIVQVPDYLDSGSTLPYASWVGGSILAKHVFPQNQFITRPEYDEYGPTRSTRPVRDPK